MATDDLTAQQLRGILDYNPETGVFVRRSTGRAVGDKSGSGYLTIFVLGKNRNAHRLAWLHYHGRWPCHNIDHINGNRQDNRIANLRDISQSHNLQNKHHSRGVSGLVGVKRGKNGKWCASITPERASAQLHLGTFDTPEEAQAAYMAAKRLLHPTTPQPLPHERTP